MTTSRPTAAAIRGIPLIARKSKSLIYSGRFPTTNAVGSVGRYAVLWTLIRAPLRGLLVETAKYSGNVGHHLWQ